MHQTGASTRHGANILERNQQRAARDHHQTSTRERRRSDGLESGQQFWAFSGLLNRGSDRLCRKQWQRWLLMMRITLRLVRLGSLAHDCPLGRGGRSSRRRISSA